jgi:dUTP pyrophosphatase
MELKIHKLSDDVPDVSYSTNEAACFDISAFIQYQSSVKKYTKDNKLVESLAVQDSDGRNYIEIPDGWRAMIPTGLIFDIPKNCSVRIYPRSGLSCKKGLNLINCVGIIDSDYVEQIFIPLYNNSQEKIKIYSGERIAQGEMIFNHRPILNYIAHRPEQKGNRSGGFGSTGV